MKKKVLSVILAAVCTMGLMAGCGAEGSKGSTQSDAKRALRKVKTLRLITRMHRQIPVRQALLQTASYLRRLI